MAWEERRCSCCAIKPIFEKGLADIIQPDLSHAGGISEVRRIAAMAEAYDIAVAPHCPLGPLSLAACLQIAASTPNHVLQEMSLGIHYNQGADLLTYVTNPEVFALTDGMLPLPTGAGLGGTVDEAAIRAAAASPHRWRNAVWRQADGGHAEW